MDGTRVYGSGLCRHGVAPPVNETLELGLLVALFVMHRSSLRRHPLCCAVLLRAPAGDCSDPVRDLLRWYRPGAVCGARSPRPGHAIRLELCCLCHLNSNGCVT